MILIIKSDNPATASAGEIKPPLPQCTNATSAGFVFPDSALNWEYFSLRAPP
jgi:hypothetical protein